MLRHPALSVVGSGRAAPRPLVQTGLGTQAERVRLPAPGVAAARRLLCDGCGPLYAEGDLGAAVRVVLELLEGPRH